MSRKPIIGVVGGNHVDVGTNTDAEEVGKLICERGAILLTGGGSGRGVKAAATKGATEGAKSAGKTKAIIHIRPGDPRHGNQRVIRVDGKVEVFTGLEDARNYINGVAPDILIALKGGPGTLSEIAFALNADRHVVYLNYWGFLRDESFPKDKRDLLHCASAPDDALKKACDLITSLPGSPEDSERKGNFPVLSPLKGIKEKYDQEVELL